ASAKDRAENVMIVDLLRNDLGRIAEFGSVEVPELFALERYGNLWQMTSEVTALTRRGIGLEEIFRALFPSGSVPGAPKHRTMALLAEHEGQPRGIYCGAIGCLAPAGRAFRARFSVAIRTVVADRATGDAVYGAGGGITWGSTAAGEHDELLAKTAILGGGGEPFELLETLCHEPSAGLRNGEAHLDRLADSAAYFGFQLDRPALVRRVEARRCAETEPHRVRIALARRGTVRVEVDPLPASPPGPVRVAVDPEPIDSQDPFCFHKTSRRDGLVRRRDR